ncbi:hypothetical protein V8F06_009375 [Rhypophila decipiens]
MIAFLTFFTCTTFCGMAILSTLSEFTGGGVTWEGGFIERVSQILVGGLAMGEHEHWAAAAASTSAAAPMVFKNNKNTKDDHQLRSRVGGKLNSTSPLPLSATMDTDAATTTIFTTTTTTSGAKAGKGHGWGPRGEAQDGLGDRWVGPLAAAATHPFAHVVGLVSAILLFVGFIRFKGISWRYLKRESWIWLRLAFLTPLVFVHHLWIHTWAAANDLDVDFVDVDEEYAKTGIIHRTVGGLRLVAIRTQPEEPVVEEPVVKENTPRKPEGGRLAGRAPWPSGRPPSGIGQKPKSLPFRQRAWRTITTKFHDFVVGLRAFITILWALACDVVRLLVQFVDGIRRTRVTLRPPGVRIEPAVQDWKEIDPDLLKSDNDGKSKKGDSSGNKGKKNVGKNAGGKGGGKKGKGRQR